MASGLHPDKDLVRRTMPLNQSSADCVEMDRLNIDDHAHHDQKRREDITERMFTATRGISLDVLC